MNNFFNDHLLRQDLAKKAIGIFLIAAGFLILTAATSNGQLIKMTKDYEPWTIEFEEARTLAKKTGRPIMLVFSGSDWCSWCRKLTQEVFSTHEFARWSTDNVVKVEVDFPMNGKLSQRILNQNSNLKNRYASELQVYPTVIFIDANGLVLGKVGYVDGGPDKWIEIANRQLGLSNNQDLLAMNLNSKQDARISHAS